MTLTRETSNIKEQKKYVERRGAHFSPDLEYGWVNATNYLLWF
ncbi:MAG: hypothetical protein ACI311_05230 [Bacilli bacterium]